MPNLVRVRCGYSIRRIGPFHTVTTGVRVCVMRGGVNLQGEVLPVVHEIEIQPVARLAAVEGAIAGPAPSAHYAVKLPGRETIVPDSLDATLRVGLLRCGKGSVQLSFD